MVNTETCDLCGLPITGKPIIKTFDGVEKHFCCQGCARVYQAAYDNHMLDQVITKSAPPKQKTETLLHPGKSTNFAIHGMWCAGCAMAAENVLKKIPGVQSADVSFAAESGRLQYDPNKVDPEKVLHTLDSLGYTASLNDTGSEKEANKTQERTFFQFLTAAAFGMQIMILYLVQLYQQYAAGQYNLPVVREMQYLAWLLATPILFYGGISFLKGAWRALRAGTATMDTLVALGTISAYGYSVYIALTGNGEAYFDSVAMITTFVMLGRWLEALGGGQARKGIRKLLNLQPQNAWLQKAGQWEPVPASKLVVGDTILVKPGERVPADSKVIKGEAAIDESLLTGESSPVEKGPGTLIYAGTVVSDNPLVAQVESPVGQTRLAQITKLVQQTLSTKPPIQLLADKASAWFAFGILAAAVLTAIGWYLKTGAVSHALINAVAVLVVACPCALGLATPMAITVTLGRASREGILVRNPKALERAGQCTRIVFDKTGTLTQGHLSVVSIHSTNDSGMSNEDTIRLAAAAEQPSEHPIAKAIQKAAEGIPSSINATDFKVLRGLGVTAQINNKRLLVGSLGLFGKDVLKSDLEKIAVDHAKKGETIVWVGWSGEPFAFIALRDEPNPDAIKLLKALKDQGLQLAMLSGDSKETTKAIAEDLGMDDYVGECMPADKAARIKAWQEKGDVVMMVGDGVNDAPALAQADLSITVAGGTDIAGETSDLILMRRDLMMIPWFITLSRRTHRIIRENLGWAFAYNLVSVPLASFGLISPVIAAAAMATSSLLVVGNSLRLRK